MAGFGLNPKMWQPTQWPKFRSNLWRFLNTWQILLIGNVNNKRKTNKYGDLNYRSLLGDLPVIVLVLSQKIKLLMDLMGNQNN